jgi:iron complex transport system substrate-binding protein
MLRLRFFLVILVAAAAAALALFRGSHQPLHKRPGELRIVSLAPNVTEILFALELGDHVVGVTDRCNYPPAAQAIERVSGFGTPSVEKLLALGPDMVIACGLEKPEFTDILRQAGTQVVNVQTSGFMASFPQLFDAVHQIGEATGRKAQAQRLVAGMQVELDSVGKRFSRIDKGHRPCVFVEIEESPLMTAGAGSFIDDLISRAGGRNVAHEISSAYPRIDPEKVIAWNPDYILVAHSDHPGHAADRLSRHIGWSDLAAVRERRVIDDIDGDLLFRPGPRLVDGVKALAARLYAVHSPEPITKGAGGESNLPRQRPGSSMYVQPAITPSRFPPVVCERQQAGI